jgi:hypothetical protein
MYINEIVAIVNCKGNKQNVSANNFLKQILQIRKKYRTQRLWLNAFLFKFHAHIE